MEGIVVEIFELHLLLGPVRKIPVKEIRINPFHDVMNPAVKIIGGSFKCRSFCCFKGCENFFIQLFIWDGRLNGRDFGDFLGFFTGWTALGWTKNISSNEIEDEDDEGGP
jgi:hypothetical protein